MGDSSRQPDMEIADLANRIKGSTSFSSEQLAREVLERARKARRQRVEADLLDTGNALTEDLTELPHYEEHDRAE